jgi:FlaA1/EpsC-like NDP-sugar epimerase
MFFDRSSAKATGGVIERLSQKAMLLPRLSKRRLVLIADAMMCVGTVYLAMFLRLGYLPPSSLALWFLIASSVGLAIPIFISFGAYREIFSQAGLRTITVIGNACVLYALVFSVVFTLAGIPGVPRTVGVIQPILLFLGVSALRAVARQWLGERINEARRNHAQQRVLIFGAGSAGRQMSAAMTRSRELRLVGFLDDDPLLQGSTINGLPILDPNNIAEIAVRLDVTDVLLALPSASQRRRNEVLEAMRAASLRVRTVPGIMDIAHGRIQISDIRELDANDLLGRDPVAPDAELLGLRIRGRTVLVTGAGGSIGSEICRQVAALGPARLLLFEVSEFALYTLHQELLGKATDGDVELIPILGSVLDQARIESVLATWRPETIYHAAAYKHVPLVEHNPAEGVRNNIFGTATVAKAAAAAGTPDFVLISTDKAVRPTNVMGATKRVAEMILQSLNETSPGTRFSMVRFGNVLGSSGSVVPLFRKQIQNGGPVTITDRRIIRYFMTIPEAAQLVIQAGAMARGGEVFVLDMGEPVRIIDLARSMIELSGKRVKDADTPSGDIEIEEVGLRPGEKLYEELLIGENPMPTGHPRILTAREGYLPLDELERALLTLSDILVRNDAEALLAQLHRLVPEFESREGAMDWVHLERLARESKAAAN